MCCKTTECRPAYPEVGCHPPYRSGCRCGCGMQEILSKKKKIKALKEVKSRLEDKLDDIKEYIKELETSK